MNGLAWTLNPRWKENIHFSPHRFKREQFSRCILIALLDRREDARYVAHHQIESENVSRGNAANYSPVGYKKSMDDVFNAGLASEVCSKVRAASEKTQAGSMARETKCAAGNSRLRDLECSARELRQSGEWTIWRRRKGRPVPAHHFQLQILWLSVSRILVCSTSSIIPTFRALSKPAASGEKNTPVSLIHRSAVDGS